jgi:hypothetical protein
MKNIKPLCIAFILTCLLTMPALAGQMDTGIVNPPPTPTVTTDGQMDTGIADKSPATTEGQIHTTSSEAVNPVTEMALSLLQSMLLLF